MTATPLPQGRNFDVTDRVVLITGAGQGIGREYAKQFAAAGAIPVIAELNEESAQRVAGEIEAAGGRALGLRTDVADPDSVQALVDAAMKKYGRIDAVINNAAIFTSLKMKPFEQIPLEEWDQVMRVNITGCFLLARAVLPAMRARGWGRIVNISSSAVPTGTKNYLHYVTSKSALVGMTSSMARELGAQGITVNCVMPGGTFTEVPRETITAEGKARLLAAQCIPREGVAMDLAGLALFLCSEASSFITGQTIACNGGLTH
ncbi:MAG TPA: glucose 1-dehydrogenase [Roseateles sp.]|nr:glucose 1-dehydrogenase [Roseateles sp.]